MYVNDSEPDLDETNLNKTEQAIKRVTDAANKAIDALKQLDREKLALSAISNVLSDATDKVPSLALANTMQLAINDLNSNLGMKITSGNIADIIGALPVGKYAGYYSSGASGTPSSYGTFEAIVMNNTTATITAIDTSNGANYVRVKTSDTWKGWERDVTGSDLSNRLVMNAGSTGMQSPFSGSTSYRLQIGMDGGITVWKTTDGGTTWNIVKNL